MEDKRRILAEDRPFRYRMMGQDRAEILFRHKPVFVATGKNFRKLERAIRSEDEYEVQLCMAKMTGNFKHGNERR